MSHSYTFSFSRHKAAFRDAIRHVLAKAPPRSLDGAAFPAYSHSNPLINWLFWKRLEEAMKTVVQDAPYENVLDFGCGSGVFLPFLAAHSQHVLGVDVNLQPYEEMKKYISFPDNIQVVDGNRTWMQEYPSDSMDLIIALDVLEHVSDLSATLDHLLHMLKPGKKLIISGPTENIFYQIGRRIAGKEFSGWYHERGVATIIHSARQKGKVEILSVLFPLLPLFHIFSLEKPSRI